MDNSALVSSLCELIPPRLAIHLWQIKYSTYFVVLLNVVEITILTFLISLKTIYKTFVKLSIFDSIITTK